MNGNTTMSTNTAPPDKSSFGRQCTDAVSWGMFIGLLALLLIVLLSGCTSSSGDAEGSSDSSNTSADVPSCEDVQVVGATLPDDYEGCQDGDTIVPTLIWDDGDCGRTVIKISDDLFAYEDDGIVTDEDLWSICFGYATEEPAADAATDCQDAVGQPLADQYPTAEDNGPACAPGTAVAGYGEICGDAMLHVWETDDGYYFARNGGDVQFSETDPTEDFPAMAAAAGCEVGQ